MKDTWVWGYDQILCVLTGHTTHWTAIRGLLGCRYQLNEGIAMWHSSFRHSGERSVFLAMHWSPRCSYGVLQPIHIYIYIYIYALKSEMQLWRSSTNPYMYIYIYIFEMRKFLHRNEDNLLNYFFLPLIVISVIHFFFSAHYNLSQSRFDQWVWSEQ